MDCPRIAARLSAATLAVSLGAPIASHAENAGPAYIGMTAQDVGVMDRTRPAYDAKGIPLGGFRLYPTLNVSGSYDDNIFKRDVEQSDYIVTVSPSVRLKSQWGRHFFEIYSGLNYYNYAEYTDENLTDWNVGSDGRLDVTRAMILTVNGSYGQYHELWSAPNNVVGFQAAPNRYFQGHADVTAAYQPNRIGLILGGSFDRYNWTDTPQIGGGFLYNDDRDQYRYQGYAKVHYDFSPGYSAFIKASYDERDFDMFYDRSGLHRSSHGFRIDGGMDIQITHLVAGEIYIGYLEHSFAQNVPLPLPNFSGFDYGAELDWYISPLFTVHVSGSRQLSDVILGGVSVADNKNVAVSADYEFRPNIILQVRGSYTDSRYVGSARKDSYPSVGVGAKYLLNRYLSLDCHYTYSNRTTDNAVFEYTDNTVSVGLALHL